MCNSAHCLPYPTLIPPSSRPRVVKTLWPGWRTPSKSPEFWFEALGPRSLACQSTGEIKVRDEALSNREWENIFSPLIPLTHFATVVRSFMLPILYPVPIQTCSNRERERGTYSLCLSLCSSQFTEKVLWGTKCSFPILYLKKMRLREVWWWLLGGITELESPDGRGHAIVSTTPSCFLLVEGKAGDTRRPGWGRGEGEEKGGLNFTLKI